MRVDPESIYIPQYKIRNDWVFGHRMNGIDTVTGLIGPYFVSSEGMARDLLDNTMFTGRKRIVRYVAAEVIDVEDTKT